MASFCCYEMQCWLTPGRHESDSGLYNWISAPESPDQDRAEVAACIQYLYQQIKWRKTREKLRPQPLVIAVDISINCIINDCKVLKTSFAARLRESIHCWSSGSRVQAVLSNFTLATFHCAGHWGREKISIGPSRFLLHLLDTNKADTFTIGCMWDFIRNLKKWFHLSFQHYTSF